MIKRCAIFVATKARARYIFEYFIESMINDGIQIVELYKNQGIVLFSNGEEWKTFIVNEACCGMRWSKAIIDDKISQMEIDIYINPARGPYAENYKKIYLPDDDDGYHILLKKQFMKESEEKYNVE